MLHIYLVAHYYYGHMAAICILILIAMELHMLLQKI